MRAGIVSLPGGVCVVVHHGPCEISVWVASFLRVRSDFIGITTRSLH